MAGLIDDLIGKLSEMSEQLTTLLEISIAKKDIIIQNDVDKLKLVTSHENAHVGKYQRAEKACAVILDDIAMVTNQNRADLTLSKLGELIAEQDEHPAYMAAYGRLKQAAETLKEKNAQNNILIENALDYIDYTVNVMRSTFSEGDDVMLDTKS